MATLGFGCEACADDAYEVRVPVGIGDHQNLSGCAFTHGDPAVFIMVPILKSQGCVVIKYCFSISQAYALVLLQFTVFLTSLY